MRVFKFGGASVKDAAGIKNVASIIQQYGDSKKLLVVVSATGKTTNALEDVITAYYSPEKNAKDVFAQVKENHIGICSNLFPENHSVYNQIQDIFGKVEKYLDRENGENYNFFYDQIVSSGELLSSIILSAYLQEIGVNNHWLDVREVIKTDDLYREATVDWIKTGENVESKVSPILNDKVIVTQGFLGSTSENYTTTLGREGSDYTAAIFSNLLNAENQTIWKDVPGVMNGDPRIFADAIFLEQISYNEAVEMTFYGATVIHPKTIKPLQNKSIPLHVRSFINPEGVGTIVGKKDQAQLPPIRIVKKNQALLTLVTKDFSFIQEDVLSTIFRAFAKANLKMNMIQQEAISFEAVVDNIEDKINKVRSFLQDNFDIKVVENLTIFTARHYTDDVIQENIKDKEVILVQEMQLTYQCLIK